MKTLITVLAIAATCCLAAEEPYNPAGTKAQRGLLALPLKKDNGNNTTSTTQKSVTNGTEDLDDVNAKITEKLKQEQGSQQGVFHVYLQDGRLQKVQYITAPITSGQQAQQQQASPSSNNQQGQTPEIISPELAEKRRVFFVEVPQERIQALQANAQQTQNIQTSTPAQYKQEESTPINVKYLPLEDTPSRASQYRQEQASEVPVVRYLPLPLSEDYSGQQVLVQYSEVQPIRGPVYSYSPQAITRILRYAPQY